MQRRRWQPRFTRREFLELIGLGAGALALNGRGIAIAARHSTPSPAAGADGTGRVVEHTLEAAPFEVELGGRRIWTWGYNGQLPGPEIRLTEGDTLRVLVRNRLPQETTVHWHGLPIPNAMDGVPGVTQPPIAPGADFGYEFVVPVAGTYLYHSHVGTQLDRALYGALIVEPAREPLSYDREFVVILDDWIDGLDGTPDDVYARLRAGGSAMEAMEEMEEDAAGTPAAGSPSQLPPDVLYPLYLINGQPAEAPTEFAIRRGDRIRLRIGNPGSATIFWVALTGHRLTVTHSDGLPVEPVTVDALRIGMGERYDVLVEADNPGVWPLVAQAEGAAMMARAIVRYNGSTGAPPPAAAAPSELAGQLLRYDMLQATPPAAPLAGKPEQVVPITLGGDEDPYVWTINGQVFPEADPIPVDRDGRIRFDIDNRSEMPHPMHLHGVSFRVNTGGGRGPLKDTVIVDPSQRLAIDWIADNPGDWAFHCHQIYHAEAGMMRVIQVA